MAEMCKGSHLNTSKTRWVRSGGEVGVEGWCFHCRQWFVMLELERWPEGVILRLPTHEPIGAKLEHQKGTTGFRGDNIDLRMRWYQERNLRAWDEVHRLMTVDNFAEKDTILEVQTLIGSIKGRLAEMLREQGYNRKAIRTETDKYGREHHIAEDGGGVRRTFNG